MSKIQGYPGYFQEVKKNAPQTDNKGQVDKQVKNFEKGGDAFKAKPVQSSYEDDHGIDQCKRVDHAKKFWNTRCENAKKSN